MFGGDVIQSWDGVSGQRKIISARVKVHAIEVTPTLRMVGLEISTSTIGSYQMVPITLPTAEALELANLIEQAVKFQHPNEN